LGREHFQGTILAGSSLVPVPSQRAFLLYDVIPLLIAGANHRKAAKPPSNISTLADDAMIMSRSLRL